MRLIYLSPHLDDAVLSAGGCLYQESRGGRPVEIWTFMCGVPATDELSDFARGMHERWGTTSAAETMALRRAEDRSAAALIGVGARHFDFLDAIYRQGTDGSWLYAEPVGAEVHPGDADLPRKIAAAALAHLQPDDTILCQLAIGRHVDHVIVRRAAELLDRPLTYVADLPYALSHPEEVEPATAGMRSSVCEVSEAAAGVWLEAIQAYASQISTLYESWELLRADLWQRWSAERGLRLWSPAPAQPSKGLDSGTGS